MPAIFMSHALWTSAAAMAVAGLVAQPAQAAGKDAGTPNALTAAAAQALGRLRADPDMLAVLDAHARLRPRAIETLSAADARQQPTLADAVGAMLEQQGNSTQPEDLVPGVSSKDITIDGAAGALRARLYTPDGEGPFPVIVYFHGGGWVIADRLAYDSSARGLARQAQALVISVDYRLAPESKFPAAWDDALASYQWALAKAATLGGDPKRIALAGEGAGGNLALATALAARDTRLQAPTHVLAVYPLTQTGTRTESYLENAIAKPLNRAMLRWFFGHLVNGPADLEDKRLQLIDADLRGLPPVTLINARIDPLRSDGAKLAAALKRAGVPVERRVYPGMTHEFFGAAAVVEKARQAQAYAGQRLRASFGT